MKKENLTYPNLIRGGLIMECIFCLLVDGPIHFWQGRGGGLKVGAYKMDFKVYISKVEELSCVTPRKLYLIILLRAPFFFHSLVCKTVKFTVKS